jgi:signal transduction histidine kinase
MDVMKQPLQPADVELAALRAERDRLDQRIRELEADQPELVHVVGSPDERKQAEIELSRQQKLLERVVAGVPALVAYHDARLIYRWVNPVFERLLGVPKERLVGRHVFEVFPEAEAAFGPGLTHVLETGETYVAQDVPFLYELDGLPKATYWDLSFVPVLDEAGEVEAVLGFGVEVSDRYEKQRLQQAQIDALRRMDEMKEQFLSVVSHELRTPLHVLLGYVTVMQKGWAGPVSDQQREHLETMRQTVDLLTKLVSDLLDMSQIQAGALSIDPVDVELMGLVSDVLGRIAPLATNKRIDIVTRMPAELPIPVADERRLGQVLLNLLGNAVKFTPEGGRITLRIGSEPGLLRVSVTDTGIGIAPEHLGKLFMRFTQLDMRSTRKAGGTGLGLSIAKAIVEAHGGEMGVESVVGQGSTFWFTLPLEGKAELGPG